MPECCGALTNRSVRGEVTQGHKLWLCSAAGPWHKATLGLLVAPQGLGCASEVLLELQGECGLYLQAPVANSSQSLPQGTLCAHSDAERAGGRSCVRCSPAAGEFSFERRRRKNTLRYFLLFFLIVFLVFFLSLRTLGGNYYIDWELSSAQPCAWSSEEGKEQGGRGWCSGLWQWFSLLVCVSVLSFWHRWNGNPQVLVCLRGSCRRCSPADFSARRKI